MNDNDIKLLLKEGLAKKEYLDEQTSKIYENTNPKELPPDIYMEEVKENGEIIIKFYKLNIDKNKMTFFSKALKKLNILIYLAIFSIALSVIILINTFY